MTEDRNADETEKTKSAGDATGKTALDKPQSGQERLAVDERGPKNIRGPEGHAKDYD